MTGKIILGFAFIRPSFLIGLAQTLDFAGCLSIYDLPSNEEALCSDWLAVGQDIQRAIDNY